MLRETSRETLSIGPRPNYTSKLFSVGRAKGSGRFFFREPRRFHMGFRQVCRRYNTRDRDIVYVQPPWSATGENGVHAAQDTPYGHDETFSLRYGRKAPPPFSCTAIHNSSFRKSISILTIILANYFFLMKQ